MSNWTAWTPSPRSRRWKRRKKSNAEARAWAWVIGVVLAVTLIGAVVWEFADQVAFQRSRRTTMRAAAIDVLSGTDFSPWQNEIVDTVEQGVSDIGQGNVSQGEVATSKAVALLRAARQKSLSAEPDFYQVAVAGLDRIWSQQPDNDGLFRRVVEARIELAELRVAQGGSATERAKPETPPKNGGTTVAAADDVIPAAGGTSGPSQAAPVRTDNGDTKGIVLTVPRAIQANFTLNPATLGNDYLDATRMPGVAEILLPPANRSMKDNVRVENLTIAGGSQSLDGIRWLNIRFEKTLLRYEKGPLDLENVRFDGCTFEFAPNALGARLATAIALGQTSFATE